MARVTYAVLALAFATLVAGFFFRHSSLPLLISIGLSGVVFVMILAGWSRRLRAAGELGLDADDAINEDDLADEILVVDLDETGEITEFEPPKARAKASAAKTAVLDRTPARASTPKSTKKSPRKTTRKSQALRGAQRPTRDEDVDFKPPPDEEDATVVVPRPPRSAAKKKTVPAGRAKATVVRKAKPKPKPKAKPRSAERRVVTIPGRDRYHLSGCRFAQGPGGAQVAESAAKRRGLVPCSVCLK